MARYAGRLTTLLRPEVAVTTVDASHINMPRPFRRLVPSYRRFAPLPPSWPAPIDVVHFTDVYLGVHARRFDAARVTTVHDTMPAEYATWRRGGARWRVVYKRSLRLLDRSDLVITPSEHTRRELLKARPLPPERVAKPGFVPLKA